MAFPTSTHDSLAKTGTLTLPTHPMFVWNSKLCLFVVHLLISSIRSLASQSNSVQWMMEFELSISFDGNMCQYFWFRLHQGKSNIYVALVNLYETACALER